MGARKRRTEIQEGQRPKKSRTEPQRSGDRDQEKGGQIQKGVKEARVGGGRDTREEEREDRKRKGSDRGAKEKEEGGKTQGRRWSENKSWGDRDPERGEGRPWGEGSIEDRNTKRKDTDRREKRPERGVQEPKRGERGQREREIREKGRGQEKDIEGGETPPWSGERRLKLREQRGKTQRRGTETPEGAQRLRMEGPESQRSKGRGGGQIFREKKTLMRDTEAGAGMGKEAIPTSRRTCRG